MTSSSSKDDDDDDDDEDDVCAELLLFILLLLLVFDRIDAMKIEYLIDYIIIIIKCFRIKIYIQQSLFDLQSDWFHRRFSMAIL